MKTAEILRSRTFRAELRAVARLATPVITVQLGMMLMGTVDSMMLGRVSETALAAGALGTGLSFGLTMLPSGILMALDPLIAQAYGAGDRRGVATHMKRGLVLAVAMAVPLSLMLVDLRGVLELLKQEPTVAAETAHYLRGMIPGVVAYLIFVAFRQTLQAMSIVRPAVIAIVVANVANVVANYALIFGHWGAPKLGVTGSAYASSISRWVMLVILVGLELPRLRDLWHARPLASMRLRGFLVPLRIGFPIGLQVSLEMWLFMTVAILMGQLGSRELAAHQITLNLSALSFMVPLGISGAAATRVGNAVGRRDMSGARHSAAVSMALGTGVMSLSAVAFWTIPGLLSRLYTHEQQVVALAATLLPIAALFQVFDGLQVVGAGVLRGAGDTRVPAILALVGYWLFALPLACVLAFVAGWGPHGLWLGLTGGLSSVAILFLLRILRTFRGEITALEANVD